MHLTGDAYFCFVDLQANLFVESLMKKGFTNLSFVSIIISAGSAMVCAIILSLTIINNSVFRNDDCS